MSVSVRRAIIQIIDNPIGLQNAARWTPLFGWHSPWEHHELLTEYEKTMKETAS